MISAIVLAAGKGTRMHSTLGKTMHKVLDKPIIGYVNDVLNDLEVDNKVFVVGYDSESIKNYLKDQVSYAVQEPQQGTAHAVMQATQLKDFKGKTLIINGDCPLITKETYQRLLDKAEEYPLVVLTTELEQPGNYGRIVRKSDGTIDKIVERKDCTEQQAAIKEINVGVYCVDNQLLWQYLPEIQNNNKQHEYYITDLIEIFISHKHQVGAILGENSQELQGINSLEELQKASNYLQNIICQKWMSLGVTIIKTENTFISKDVTIGSDTIIYPNVRIEGKTVIGNNCVIEEGSYLCNVNISDNVHIISSYITDTSIGESTNVGPNAHLRNGCQIGDHCRIGNYVEMKNVVFGSGSKCAHLTYIGDTTVGEKCNFGCGVVTVNYDGKNKYHTTIGNHCFVGSNVNIIAPVTIKDYSVLAAGTTVTKDVETGEMAIGRVKQENKPEYGYKYLNK